MTFKRPTRLPVARAAYGRAKWPLAVLLALPIVGGCDFNPEEVFKVLPGHEASHVVLAAKPVLLTPNVAAFNSEKSMKVIGEMTSVCVSLRDGLPLQDMKTMDQAFDSAMQGANVKVTAILSDGQRVSLGPALQAWKMYGRILKKDELSACASARCGASLPVGSVVSKIEVSAEPALKVQGIYWESEKSPTEATNPSKAPSTGTASASQSIGRSSCS
jgi:hypothetical protein